MKTTPAVEIQSLLKARSSLLWIPTREERRAERVITDAVPAETTLWFWDTCKGITDTTGAVVNAQAKAPNMALDYLTAAAGRVVLVMRDLHQWWSQPLLLRQLRTLSRDFRSLKKDQAKTIVVVSPPAPTPADIETVVAIVDFPLPDRDEISNILDVAIKGSAAIIGDNRPVNGAREAVIDAALGLTDDQIRDCFSQSIVRHRQIDAGMVAYTKRRVIAASKLLEWYEPDETGMDSIGGLDALKSWLSRRRKALTPEAREAGIDSPRGLLLVGISGCGKSLTAKCVASAWGLPLLRLDLGAMRSKFVGESEQNIRRALQVADSVSPCVVWLDEMDKAMAGASGPAGDSGVAADALGYILTWMQEKQGAVFVVATANDPTVLPPEFTRKGRFDEMFFVDLPTPAERAQILQASLARRLKQSPKSAKAIKWTKKLADATVGFTGAEIDAMVVDAKFAAFDENRSMSTDDLVAAAESTVPLSKSSDDVLRRLRDWAKGRCRRATTETRRAESSEFDLSGD